MLPYIGIKRQSFISQMKKTKKQTRKKFLCSHVSMCIATLCNVYIGTQTVFIYKSVCKKEKKKEIER